MPGTRIERCPSCQICCKQLKADKRYVKIGNTGISLSIVARTGKACHLVGLGSFAGIFESLGFGRVECVKSRIF